MPAAPDALVSDTTFPRHRGPVTCAHGVPRSTLVLCSGYDDAVSLFDTERREATLLGYHDHLVNSVAVNADGTRAASCSSDYTVGLWDLVGRERERTLVGHTDDVEAFTFVDGGRGASASRDHTVILWDLATGEVLRRLTGHDKDVLSLAYHDGLLISSGDDMTLRVWDVETGEMVRMWGPFETETDTCALDPSRGRVVLGCDDGFVRVFALDSGDLLGTIEAHRSAIKKVAVSPATGDILSAAYDQQILIWDAADFRLKQTLEGHPAKWERSFNWSEHGDRIFAGTFDGTVVVWDARTGERLDEIGAFGDEPGNACFNEVATSGEGTALLVSDDGLVRLAALGPDRAAWLSTFAPDDGRILMNAGTLSLETGLAATGTHDQRVQIYDVAGDALSLRADVHLGEGPINSVRISGHPGTEGDVFVACYSGAIVQADRDGAVRNTFFVHENAVKALRLHPTRPVGVSCSADGILTSWGLDGTRRSDFEQHSAIVNDVDLSPDGERVASVGREFRLKVYDLDSAALLHAFALGARSLKSVCFHSDAVVVVGDYWGALIRVDLASGDVRRATVAGNGISALARVDGRHVAAASYDGSVYVVDAETLAPVATLTAMAQRPRSVGTN